MTLAIPSEIGFAGAVEGAGTVGPMVTTVGPMTTFGHVLTSTMLMREFKEYCGKMKDAQKISKLAQIICATSNEINEAFMERDVAIAGRESAMRDVCKTRMNEGAARQALERVEEQLKQNYDTHRTLRILAAAGIFTAVGCMGGFAIGTYAGWVEASVVATSVGASVIGTLAGAGIGVIWDGLVHRRVKSENRDFFQRLAQSNQV